MDVDHPVTTVRNLPSGRRGPARVYLLVLRGDRFEAHELPASGEVTLGRDDTCTVQIAHPSISRMHARIHLGPPLAIVDLGSSNGTQVGETTLEPNRPAPFAFNESLALGSVTIIVQQRATPVRRLRLRSHDYFEGRVEEECARAEHSGGSFGVLRIQFSQTPPRRTIQMALAETLRKCDVAAVYSPTDYEVLLIDAEADDVTAISAGLETLLSDEQASCVIGGALYPDDGTSPDGLIAHAAADCRGVEEPSSLVLKDPAMKHLYTLAERVAAGTISVLVIGETGVGKEVLAAAVHKSSPRAEAPYVRLNCAALTDSLFESELFGHEKGAFTGADRTKPGLLETADGGTVFLDEIGELSPAAQAKLLRVLEERKVLRVGGLQPRPIDVRFIAATNRDLEDPSVFRPDLYYRIAGVTLAIPPLRHRRSEIVDLAQVFIASSCAGMQRTDVPVFSEEARRLLTGYSWPGNIRELRNMVERAVLLSMEDEIGPEHLPVEKMTGGFTAEAPVISEGDGERERIVKAMGECGGNQTEAARRLGISRRTLAKRLETYNIARPRKRRTGTST